MKKDKLTLRVEVEKALENQPMSEVNFSIKMQKLVLFLYTESTIFFFFLMIIMGSFFWKLCMEGPTKEVIFLGLAETLIYLPFYHYVIKNIKPFKNRASEYEEIKDRLDALLDYKEFRMTR